MNKHFIAGAVAALAAFNASALSAGDLAFTAFNADEDGWAMVALSGIAANTTVYFTDNEYVSGAFNTSESYHKWVSGGAPIAAGAVIRFSAIDVVTLSASVGTLSRESVPSSNNYGINQTADTIYAYQGTSATTPTTFLAAISNGAFSAAEGPLTGTGLSVGNGAVQLSNSSDFAQYTGARSGQASFANYKALVSNVANWTVQGDGTFAAQAPNITAFTITPVPEPQTYAMMLAGLAAVGTLVRRRRVA